MAGSSSLCPGYKQVEAFGLNDEYEYEDEDEISYVTLDLGAIEPTLVPSSSTYRMIGLDTPAPFLQLSGTIFTGRHDSLLGTELLFTDGKDAQDWSKRSITHVANTEQRIHFKEVRLQPKAAPASPESAHQSETHQKGKGKEGEDAAGTTTAGASQLVDRMTGKITVVPRAPRTRGEGAKGKSKKSTATPKGKAKEKEKAGDDAQEDAAVDETANAMDVSEG